MAAALRIYSIPLELQTKVKTCCQPKYILDTIQIFIRNFAPLLVDVKELPSRSQGPNEDQYKFGQDLGLKCSAWEVFGYK